MLHFMNSLTNKLEWHKKVFDTAIASKWKAEALSEGMTEKMVDWCMAELQYKAGILEKTGAVRVFNGDVVKSDTAIPESLKESLKAAVAALENVPDIQKDWHPGSDNKVLDLVHPSLYPLVYGRTRILRDSGVSLEDCIERCGEGVTVQPKAPKRTKQTRINRRDDEIIASTPFSKTFQWLPCDVDISGGEGNVKIESYINNLHPEIHKPLYTIIEEIISRTIPLWNMTLTPLNNRKFIRRINDFECKYGLSAEMDEPKQEEGENDRNFYRRRSEWYEINKEFVIPEPGLFSSVPFDKAARRHAVDLWKDYADGLQIIVKLANIHLTPEDPHYDGGSWHVEGQLNERICASAIYYYDSDNITMSRLEFRQQCTEYEATGLTWDHGWMECLFDKSPGYSGVQDVGNVRTPEGRLLTWPNILEHRVQPFRLKDKTKPGHRKILALFLVDPHTRIISTSNVPCQQHKWWADAVLQNQDNPMFSLPLELRDHIFNYVEDFPIGLEEAKKLRLELMKERKVYVNLQNEAFRFHEFSLCEH